MKEPLFEVFWKQVPKDDAHGMWTATRKIKTGKAAAYKAWCKAIAEGNNGERIIAALEAELKDRQQASTLKGGNAMRFMKNPANWLESRAYLDFDDEEDEKTDTAFGAGFE